MSTPNPQKTEAKIKDIRGRVFFDCSPATVTDKDGNKKSEILIEVNERMRLPLVSAAAVILAKSGHANGTIIKEPCSGNDKLGHWSGFDAWLRDQDGKMHHLATIHRQREQKDSGQQQKKK